jgi:hypothetical protein
VIDVDVLARVAGAVRELGGGVTLHLAGDVVHALLTDT